MSSGPLVGWFTCALFGSSREIHPPPLTLEREGGWEGKGAAGRAAPWPGCGVSRRSPRPGLETWCCPVTAHGGSRAGGAGPVSPLRIKVRAGGASGLNSDVPWVRKVETNGHPASGSESWSVLHPPVLLWSRMEEQAAVSHPTAALHPGVVPSWWCGLGPVASQVPHLSNGNLNVYEDDSGDNSLTVTRL